MNKPYTYLFKNKIDSKKKINKFEYHYFILKIIFNIFNDTNIDNILLNTELWNQIDLFQNKNNHITSFLKIKHAFMILGFLIVKKFPTLKLLSQQEIMHLITLGKDISLMASEIPDIINFIKIKKIQNFSMFLNY